MLNLPDKDTSWNFKFDKLPVDLSPIIKEVEGFTEEWLYDTSRQDKMATHKYTEMFQLKFMSYNWQPGEGDTSHDVHSFKNKNAQEKLLEIYNHLEKIYNAKVIRTEIVKMHGKSNIKPHVDGGIMLQLARRIHIPLITNPRVTFEVFGESKYLEVGSWYEINNIIPHSVINDSELDRTHFIIDIMPIKHLAINKD